LGDKSGTGERKERIILLSVLSRFLSEVPARCVATWLRGSATFLVCLAGVDSLVRDEDMGSGDGNLAILGGDGIV
jgi:hypothetical protein